MCFTEKCAETNTENESDKMVVSEGTGGLTDFSWFLLEQKKEKDSSRSKLSVCVCVGMKEGTLSMHRIHHTV